MGRYTEKYWDNTMPGADAVAAVVTGGLTTLMEDEGPSYGCEITDSETGLVGTTHRYRSSKAKAREDAWEDLMEKQADYYENLEREYKQREATSYSSTSKGEGTDLIALLVKGAVYILIAVGVLWLIFSVAIPLLVINLALIALIIGLTNKKLQKFVFPLSLLGMIFLMVDFKIGWFTKALATNVSFLSGSIPFFFYLNIIAGLTAGYFLIRDMINKKNPPAAGEKELSQRNLIIIGCLVITAVSIIGLQKYFDSRSPGSNNYAVREYKPETIIASAAPIEFNKSEAVQNDQKEPEGIPNAKPEPVTETVVSAESTPAQNQNNTPVQTENVVAQDQNNSEQTENSENDATANSSATLTLDGNWKGIKEAVGKDFEIYHFFSLNYTADSKRYSGSIDNTRLLTTQEILWAKSKIRKQFGDDFIVYNRSLDLSLMIGNNKEKIALVLFKFEKKLYAFAGGQSFYKQD